jgi:hypothetical protein
VYLLERSRSSQSWLALGWLIPLQIVWCNMHGGFLAGLGLIGIYAWGEALARRPFWPFLLTFVLAGVATLLNPYGYKYWTYLIPAVTMPRPEIGEWASTAATLMGGPYRMISVYFLLIVYIVLSLLWLSRPRDITLYLVLGITLLLGLKHMRHQTFFLLAASAYMAAPFSDFLRRLRHYAILQPLFTRLRVYYYVVAYLGLLSYVSWQLGGLSPCQLLTPSSSEHYEQRIYYPTAALEYVRKHKLTGKIVTEFHWGEYLLWHLHPQCLIVLDGRYETVYPEKVVRPYMDFIAGREGWQRFLEEYPPDMILIENNSKLAKFLRERQDWQEVFADQGSILFLRQERSAHVSASQPSSPRPD